VIVKKEKFPEIQVKRFLDAKTKRSVCRVFCLTIMITLTIKVLEAVDEMEDWDTDSAILRHSGQG
jgi:hypothetical protein